MRIGLIGYDTSHSAVFPAKLRALAEEEDGKIIVGTWKDGRMAMLRGDRKSIRKFGGTVYGGETVAFRADGDFYGVLNRHLDDFSWMGSSLSSGRKPSRSLLFSTLPCAPGSRKAASWVYRSCCSYTGRNEES